MSDQGRGNVASAAGVAAGTKPNRRGFRRRIVFGLILLGVLVGGGRFGYQWWYDGAHFVSTENAQVSGRLIQVGGLSAGRIASLTYEVGDRVSKDDTVATLHQAQIVGQTSNGAPRLEYRQTEDALVSVQAPISGIVVARNANAGDTVQAGQSLLTIVDPRRLWINANIEETQIRKIEVGQPVDIVSDILHADVTGRVVAITPASATTFSLIPPQTLSGNYTRVTQLVPVRIELTSPDPRLTIGTSVSVKIRFAS